MFQRTVFLIVLFGLMSGNGRAFTFECGYDPQSRGENTDYDYDEYDTVRMKFIYVAFQGDDISRTITASEHAAVVQVMADYLDKQSNHHLTLSDDSGILFMPGDDFSDREHTAQTWQADLDPQSYWYCEGEMPPGYQYGFLADWWTAGAGCASILYSEILYKIWNAYEEEPENPFPTSRTSDQDWNLILVFLSRQSPFANCPEPSRPVGGRPDIRVNTPSVFAVTGDFYRRVKLLSNGFAGSGQAAEFGEWPSTALDIESTTYKIVHEFVHTLGPGDGPPGLQNCCSGAYWNWCEERYYFGNLNLLGQHYVHVDGLSPFEGLPSVADPWLAGPPPGRFLPWRDITDFDATTLRNERIYNLGDGGGLYRFSLGRNPAAGQDEYFVIAYHGPGEPAVPSQGLAIWHCIGKEMFDLESAVGLWDFTHERAFIPPWNDLDENRTQGYDNYDLWGHWGPDPHGWADWDGRIAVEEEGGYHWGGDYATHRGTNDDFFTGEPSGPGEHRQALFADWTNPSCQGYHPQPIVPAPFFRRRPQDQPNSLIVRVTGQGQDENGDYLIVDLLPGPCGTIVYPNGTLPLPQGTCQIQWAYDAYPDLPYGAFITAVDISYSNNGGLTYPYSIVEGLPAGGAVTTHDWAVLDAYASHAGRLKIVFYNSLSEEHHGTAISFPFEVSGDYTVQEGVLMPTGGEQWYTGQQQELRWTSYFNGQENVTADVAVDYSKTGGEPWTELISDLDYELITPEVGDSYNSATINVPYAMNGAAVWLRLRFRYQNPEGPLTQGLDVTDGPIVVYPVERVFSDVTAASNLTYQGRPYSAIALEASSTPDQLPDLFVTIADAAGTSQENSVLYLNVTYPGQSPSFEATTDAFVPGDRPQLGSLGACAAPLVAGQPDALFVTHQEASKPRLYIFGNDPSYPSRYANVADQETGAWFSAAAVTDSLYLSTCAAWCDLDHDGDLDLHVGRGVVDGGVASDVVFENKGPGAQTRFARRPDVLFPAASRRTMVWFDRDGDWQWDVMLGGAGGSEPSQLHWREQAGFGWSFGPRYPFVAESSALSLSTVDDNGDGILDVLLVNDDGVVSVLNSTGDVFSRNPVEGSILGGSATVGDVDLDGWPDIVVASETEATAGAQLLRNLRGRSDYHQRYQDYTLGSGLSGQAGTAYGSLLADLDSDADLDVLVGRLDPGGRLFSSALPAQEGPLPPRWLRVHLGPESAANPASIGATVALYTDASHTLPFGMQIVDGGSGRGSQRPRSLLFGLGEYAGDVYVNAVWPRGHVTSVTYEGVSGDLTVNPDLSLDLVSGRPPLFTLSFSVVEGLIVTHWTFEWWTDGWTVKANDRVEVTPGSGCSFTPISIIPGTPGVTGTSVPVLDGGMLIYHHTLTWVGAPCLPQCTIHYRFEGDDGEGHALGTNGFDYRMPKLCPLSQ
jgi:hypothetical protein